MDRNLFKLELGEPVGGTLASTIPCQSPQNGRDSLYLKGRSVLLYLFQQGGGSSQLQLMESHILQTPSFLQ